MERIIADPLFGAQPYYPTHTARGILKVYIINSVKVGWGHYMLASFVQTIKNELEGGVFTDTASRARVSHDASIYEITPEVVVHPKNTADVERLVRCIRDTKELHPTLALTPRSAGTDMSGAAIGSSVVIEMTPHFHHIERLEKTLLHTQPGVFMRDIDPVLAKEGQQLGFVPASRALCTIGGMVANNSGGEQSLRYGNADRWVREIEVVLSDGKAHRFKALTKKQLNKKMAEDSYEGRLYKTLYELIEANYDTIKNARPHVNKNSAGYNLWDVWNRETGIFNLCPLFAGSQGTLGVITDLVIETVPKAVHTGMLLVYLPSIKKLGTIIDTVMRHQPSAFEGFDDITFNLGIRYFKTFRRQLGTVEYLRQQAWLTKEVARFHGHLPNILLMIEFEGATPAEVLQKITALQANLTPFKVRTTIEGDEKSEAPFWQIRRAALGLLRNQIKGRYASPFIDDMAVQTKYLPEFIPELRKVIRKYKLPATIQGHFGDGNFHVIPLMDIAGTKDEAKLEPVLRELIPIVLKYGGTMAGEHNDGMVRGPWLPAFFGEEVAALFRQVKETFDPYYIFNPNKKTDASWEYSMSHIRTSNTIK